jgi:hypothetical protein
MSSGILTKDEWLARCKEIADKFNADVAAMPPEERQEAIDDLNAWARQIGGFPPEDGGEA